MKARTKFRTWVRLSYLLCIFDVAIWIDYVIVWFVKYISCCMIWFKLTILFFKSWFLSTFCNNYPMLFFVSIVFSLPSSSLLSLNLYHVKFDWFRPLASLIYDINYMLSHLASLLPYHQIILSSFKWWFDRIYGLVWYHDYKS